MKNTYVSALKSGDRIDDVFLVHDKSYQEAKNGSMFIRIKLGDRTGSIDAFMWDADEAAFEQIPDDDFVHVRGSVNTFNSRLQVKIESCRPWAQDVDPADFVAPSRHDANAMLSEMRGIIASVRQPQLRALLGHFFDDEEFVTRFSGAPAAKRVHHACIGGLLEHSLSVAKLCEFVASHYSGVDRDMLLTGAILHDIGKTDELSWDKSIRYSDAGHLLGHIVSGAIMVERAMDEIDGFDPTLKLLMTHVIVAHHGEREFGAPTLPQTLETLILHHVEDMDAKVNMFQQALADCDGKDESDRWTEKHWLLGRQLFRGMPASSEEAAGLPIPASPTSDDDYDPFREE